MIVAKNIMQPTQNTPNNLFTQPEFDVESQKKRTL